MYFGREEHRDNLNTTVFLAVMILDSKPVCRTSGSKPVLRRFSHWSLCSQVRYSAPQSRLDVMAEYTLDPQSVGSEDDDDDG